MGERILQKVVLHLEAEQGKTVAVKAFTEQLKECGIEVTCVSEHKTYESAAQAANTPKGGKLSLCITDCPHTATTLAASGYPVLGILTKENKDASFGGVRFLAENISDCSVDYLERVYRRYKGLPWTILKTPRCILRETTEADLEAFYKLYAEPSITCYMDNLSPDREAELQYIRQYRENVYAFYDFGIWTVILKETGEVIGRAGLEVKEGFAEPELGFMIGVPWQRQGLAREVSEAILRYAAVELEIPVLAAEAALANEASVALLGKLGFEALEGASQKGWQRFWKRL